MNLRVIFFDLDDTLFPAEAIYRLGLKAAWQRLRKEKALSWPAFLRLYQRARQEVKGRLGTAPAARSRTIYFKRMLELSFGGCRPRLTLDLVRAYRTAWKKIDPAPARRLAARLSKRFTLGIVTNQLTLFQLEKMERIDPDGRYFTFLVTSEEAGVEKPVPQFFRMACRLARCRPAEALVVGNSWTDDVQGAVRAGLSAAYVYPGKLMHRLPSRAIHVKDLKEFENLFQRPIL